MADTIGRVEFIVGLDGKRLSAEAKKAGRQLAKAGEQGGEDYGKGFGEGAEYEIDSSLNKAIQRLQVKLSKQGKLAGKTYAGNLRDEAISIFRKMEKQTIKALSSKEGFANFAKNFDEVDDAVKALEKNVKRLSKQKIQIFDEKGVAIAGQFEKFFKDFDAGPAMQQVDKWSRKIKESEQATKDLRDANEALRVNFDRLRASIDNVSFDKLAKDAGGAEVAADRLRNKMIDLADAGGVTEREFNRFNITLEKQVERYNAAAKAASDKLDKDRDLAAATRKLKDESEALDKALLSIENKMGDAKTFARYVKSIGSVSNAHKTLSNDIDLLGSRFGANDRKVGQLRRTLANLVDSIENTGGAASEAASGGLSKLTDALKKMLGNKGGMSTGTIVGIIASLGAAIGALGSAASAALVGLISSLGVAIVGLGAAAGAAGVGIIWMATHAMAALEMMNEQWPAAQRGMDALAQAAKNDSAAFARAWGPALADFTEKLAQLWRDDKMGERAGEALGKITEAFTAVISSPAYLAFQEAMETTIPNALVSLGDGAASLVEGLLLIFAEVGPMLEEMMGQFAAWAQGWEDAIKTAAGNGELQTFFDLALDSITEIMDLLLALGGLLGTVFTAGAPTGNAMLDMLSTMIGRLDDFFKSPEGQDQLQTWFDNGFKLFDILLDLIEQIGGQFGKMITPEIMDDMLTALSNLGDGLQIIFDLLEILGGLDVFGVIIAAFEALSALVSPLVEPLSTLAAIIGDVLLTAFEALTPIMAAVGEVLAPIVAAFAEMVGVIMTALIPVIETLVPLIVAIVEAFTPVAILVADVVTKAFELLWPIIQIVIDFISQLIEEITPLIEEILPVVASLVEAFSTVLDALWPIIQVVATILGGILKVALTIIIEAIKILVPIVGTIIDAFGKVVDYITSKVTPIFEEFGHFIDDIWQAISDSIDTAIKQILGFFRSIKKVVDDAIGWFQSLFGAANDAKGAASGAGGGAGGRSAGIPAARGMLLTFPRRVLAGEDGPEAIVPLRRPLSEVDPSVRALSAVAQGMPNFGSGGVVGSGTSRIVNIQSGAVVVQGNMAPEATATMTVNRIAERIAG
jgi:phage-related protein